MENPELNEVSVENSKGERVIAGFVIAVALLILLGYALLQMEEGEPEGAWNDNHQISYIDQRDSVSGMWSTIDTIYTNNHMVYHWIDPDTLLRTYQIRVVDTGSIERIQIYYTKDK